MATNFSIDAVREIGTIGAINTGNNFALARDAVVVQIRDNTKFVDKFDASKVIGVLRPKRTLVVGQQPAAGTFIPVGTPVDLTVTVKDTLPLAGLKDIDARVFDRFNSKSIGDVLNTLGDNTDVSRVFGRADAVEYDTLSTSDKAVVNAYLTKTFGFEAAADPVAAKSAYGSVKFLNDL